PSTTLFRSRNEKRRRAHAPPWPLPDQDSESPGRRNLERCCRKRERGTSRRCRQSAARLGGHCPMHTPGLPAPPSCLGRLGTPSRVACYQGLTPVTILTPRDHTVITKSRLHMNIPKSRIGEHG